MQGYINLTAMSHECISQINTTTISRLYIHTHLWYISMHLKVSNFLSLWRSLLTEGFLKHVTVITKDKTKVTIS